MSPRLRSVIYRLAVPFLALVLYLAGVSQTFADPIAVEVGRRIAVGGTEVPKCAKFGWRR